MRKRGLKLTLFILFACLFMPLGLSDYKGVSQGDIDRAEEEVKRAEKELQAAKDKEAELVGKINQLSGNISNTQSYIQEVDQYMAQISARIYELDSAILDKQNEISVKEDQIYNTEYAINLLRGMIADSKNDLAEAHAAEARQFEAMKLRIKYMYENGDDRFIEILFSSENMIDFLNNVEYISEISKYDREKLIEFGETKDNIATLLANLEGQESELLIQESNLEAALAELNAQLAVLDSMKEEQEVQMSTYNAIYEAKNRELANLQNQKTNTEEQRRIAELEIKEQEERAEQAKQDYLRWLEELAKQNKDAEEAARIKLAEIGMNGLTWPLPGYNTITSQFGMRRHPILGYDKLHDGTDISGYNVDRKPIVAAYSGTVVLSEYYWGYGECIKIDHGGSIQTLYAHCSTRLVSVGQHVNAGDTIALVGSTGNSTGPHLHFSFIIKGEFVNPLDYIVVPTY